MTLISALNERFALPGLLTFETGQGGLARGVITASAGEAHVYLHGAHVTHFQPRGAEPALFVSRESHFEAGKAIRGGVPVIFPWFGPKAGDPAAAMHGFARVMDWNVVGTSMEEDDSASITLELAASDATRRAWPHEFRLQYTVTVGRSLALSLSVANRSAVEFRFEEALHTYLAVSDVRSVQIEGLSGRGYLDKVDAMRQKTQGAEPIRIEGETDRVYLDTSDTVTVHDPGAGRQLIIRKEGSQSTVVWNPWNDKARAMSDFGDNEWPQMLCVETANASSNAIRLAPAATHKMRAVLETDRLVWL